MRTTYKNTTMTTLTYDAKGKIIGAKGFFTRIPGHKKIVPLSHNLFWQSVGLEYMGD